MPREIWWVVLGADQTFVNITFRMIPGTVQTCPQISWMKNCFDVWALVHLYSSPPKCRQMTSQKSNETKYWNLSCCWCQVPGWVLNQQNLWFSHSLSWSIAPRGHGNKSTLNFENRSTTNWENICRLLLPSTYHLALKVKTSGWDTSTVFTTFQMGGKLSKFA